jgi:ABC-type polysaccharide/polyol phosphate export permease
MFSRFQDAIQLALGSFYPNLLLSGIIWPLEGMPQVLRYLSYVLPQTFACEAMRGILSRGWGMEYMQVRVARCTTILSYSGSNMLNFILRCFANDSYKQTDNFMLIHFGCRRGIVARRLITNVIKYKFI